MAASAANRGMRVVVLVMLLACGLGVPAHGFAGGTGEPNDPYQIATLADLLRIGPDPILNRQHFVLVADIDLGGTTLSWPVIGELNGTLDGQGHTIRNLQMQSYGDRGFIRGLMPGAEVRNLGLVDVHMICDYVGVLVRTNFGSVINCYSTGVVEAGDAGGLVGDNVGMVANCHSSVRILSELSGGGIAVWNQGAGTISSCYALGDVTVASDLTGSLPAGGLAVWNSGLIAGSYAKGAITSQGPEVGGLVGQNWGIISGCYATGSVTGQESVGGVAGSNKGLIVSSYGAATVVSRGPRAGGLVGMSEKAGGIVNCFSAGTVAAADEVGGLVGSAGGKILASYSVTRVTCRGSNAGGLVGRLLADPTAIMNSHFLARADSTPGNGIGTPLTDAQMKQRTSFVGWDFWGAAPDGVDDTWFLPGDAYPVLAWQTDITGLRAVPNVQGLSLANARAALTAAGFAIGKVGYDFCRATPAGNVICANPYPLAANGAAIDLSVCSGAVHDWAQNPGAGTAEHPYQIGTAGQLESLTSHPELWDKHFVLSADLDMTGRAYNAPLIAPDANNFASGWAGRADGRPWVDPTLSFQGTPFVGTFDGQGHLIRKLTIQCRTRNYLGLFGVIGSGARVDNLQVLDVDISGETGAGACVGALAGSNLGTITHCSATGVLHGGEGDGLVGRNSGTITDCHAEGVMRM